MIPDFPAAAIENYPLIITLIIYTIVLLTGFITFLRYGIETIKSISESFTVSIRELTNTFTSSIDKLSEQNAEQTKYLIEIKEKLDKDDEPTRPRRRSVA